jgi:hypothetical protein
VRRLGIVFNAVVATQRSIRSRLETTFPELASRFTTIACRMDLPDSYPERRRNPDELTVLIGCPPNIGHPIDTDPGKLAAMAAERGRCVKFTCVRGMLPAGIGERETTQIEEPTRMGWLALYESCDVLLTNLPCGAGDNHVWEAMARGCVPVFQGDNVPGILVDDQTGFCLPSGSDSQISAIVMRLACDPEYLEAISLRAFAIATTRIARQHDVIDDYLNLFDQMRSNLAGRRYRRPRGPIQFPPSNIDGTNIFPLEATYVAKGIGPFPSLEDFLGYESELKASRRAPRSRDIPIHRG